jgi:uncharacterized RDD family membrane protein YckC
MSAKIEFETPENIQVGYQPAGLGTRFLAWFVDNIVLVILGIVIFMALVCSGVVTDKVLQKVAPPVRDAAGSDAEGKNKSSPAETHDMLVYLLGISTVVWGLGSFVYYGASELALRGQTLGKRLSGIRVVKRDGFALEAGSIVVRNIFRVVDHLPPLWLVPLLSPSSQRLGDMVAGTIVVLDKPESLSGLREALASEPRADARFSFDNSVLKRARPQDFEAIEKILERWSALKDPQRQALLDQIVPPLVARLQVESPVTEERSLFLQELLAAEYRRQHRRLG